MTKATQIRQALLGWYQAQKRDLPWRATRDPYRIWVSEVMLQQTQVQTVIPFYRRFLETFATVEQLAGADLQQVLKAWEGLGYYSRARHLHQAARRIVNQAHGHFPQTPAAVKALPGVGDYIAAAVLSIAFGLPMAVVDGNVKRVLARLYCLEAPVNHSPSRRVFQETADRLLDRRRPGAFNQALMELGALVCRPRHPRCPVCPLARHCCAFSQHRVAALPNRINKRRIPTRRMTAGVVVKGRQCLIVQRPQNGLLGGLWEFPGAYVSGKAAPEPVCARSLQQQAGLHVQNGQLITRVKHAFTHFKVDLMVFGYQLRSGRVRLQGPVAHRWIRPKALMRYPLSKMIHKCLPAVESWFESA